MIALPVSGRDAVASVSRALLRSAAESGLSMTVEPGRSRPWASATFVGTQISLALLAPCAPALGRWLADLPLADLPMRRHLVASLAVDMIEDNGRDLRADLSVLVIDQD